MRGGDANKATLSSGNNIHCPSLQVPWPLLYSGNEDGVWLVNRRAIQRLSYHIEWFRNRPRFASKYGCIIDTISTQWPSQLCTEVGSRPQRGNMILKYCKTSEGQKKALGLTDLQLLGIQNCVTYFVLTAMFMYINTVWHMPFKGCIMTN